MWRAGPALSQRGTAIAFAFAPAPDVGRIDILGTRNGSRTRQLLRDVDLGSAAYTPRNVR